MTSTEMNVQSIPKKKAQSNSISSGRWAAYAAAGVASTVALAPSCEAEVHYSGIVKYNFAAHGGHGTFPLDPGANLVMNIGVATGASDFFGHAIVLGADGAFVGQLESGTGPLASALPARVNLSQERFAVSCRHTSSSSRLVCYYSGDNIGDGFRDKGVTFLGFRFTDNRGTHYGWARVKLSGAPKYQFTLVDYAWADPGEALQTGQKKSIGQADATTKSSSLGLLALGGAGLKAWRAQRVAESPLLVR